MLKSVRVIVAVVAMTTIAALACARRSTRGWWERAPDGKTYLVIQDDNFDYWGP